MTRELVDCQMEMWRWQENSDDDSDSNDDTHADNP